MGPLHLQPVPWLGPIVLGTCALIAELYQCGCRKGTVSVAALDLRQLYSFLPSVHLDCGVSLQALVILLAASTHSGPVQYRSVSHRPPWL